MPERCLMSTMSGRFFPYHEDPALAAHRRRLLQRAEGRVLDISERSDVDKSCFHPARVISLTEMSRAELDRPDEFDRPRDLDAADDRMATFDTIVSCLTLCTVASLAQTLAAVCRWLTPGGQLLVVEHVLGTGVTGLVQSTFSPVTRSRLTGGGVTCRFDQDLPAALREAGLLMSDCARFTARIGSSVPVPCLAGVARTAEGAA